MELLNNAESAFTIFPHGVNDPPPPTFFFPSLMDREVTLLREMDKVKAESSKYLQICLVNHHTLITSQEFASHNMIIPLTETDLNHSQNGSKGAEEQEVLVS